MNDIKIIEVFLNGEKVGQIAMTSDFLCAFEYDFAYLLSGSSISPFNLPLKQEVFIAKRTPFNGGFGVFDDSLPDGWGNLILDSLVLPLSFSFPDCSSEDLSRLEIASFISVLPLYSSAKLRSQLSTEEN